MNQIALTGLKADLPIGAMAAFGLFRVCDGLHELGKVRLHWQRGSGSYCAVLSTDTPLDEEQVVTMLFEHMQGAVERREFLWAEQIKSATREIYTAAAKKALQEASFQAHAEADWFAAFACDLVVKDEDILASTPFDMSVARQKFLADAVNLAASLGAGKNKRGLSPADSFREALFGPWRYEDDQHALGWDPSTMRLGAYTFKAPTEMANTGVRAAVWLALESLPLFPCFCVDGKLHARGFLYQRRMVEFSWPVWSHPISLPALKSLLALPAITEELVPVEELQPRGVVAVFRSRRAKPNKYITSFQPAVLCAGG